MSPHNDSGSDEFVAPPQMFCRTCRRPLNTRARAGRIEYLHAEQLRGGAAGHPAEPVTAAEIGTVVLVCDFCSAADPVWIYTGADQETDIRVVTSEVVDFGDYQRRHRAARTVRADTEMGPLQQWGERWTACDGCAAYLDARNLYGLIGRVVDRMAAKYRRGSRLARTRADLHALYSPLFATLQPGRTAITDEHPGQRNPTPDST
ncbi:hypothetical protein GCM10009557_01320 [Virgisporangium ochraceum]|uniref:Uncharacterized protein n=1 Tax=Virgisporangium ochraceum TaxID=65505 RepID=A0A8J4A3J3_9ACTN|nr:hypothetical protein [Virgisporangium ochraceum]GIJ74163.1 hypothetical protein Voc01_090800 [Virgisporangium ochraceum]